MACSLGADQMAHGRQPTAARQLDARLVWHRTPVALQVPVDLVTLASCNFDAKAYLIGGLACDPNVGAYTTPVGIVQVGSFSSAAARVFHFCNIDHSMHVCLL